MLTPLFSLHLPVLPLGTTLRRCIRLAARESASFSTCFPAPPRLIATHPLGIKTNQKRDGRSSRKPGTFGPLARYYSFVFIQVTRTADRTGVPRLRFDSMGGMRCSGMQELTKVR